MAKSAKAIIGEVTAMSSSAINTYGLLTYGVNVK